MAVKRSFDFLFALLGTICFAPLLILIACLIGFEDGWPILFSQQRLGKGMRLFVIYKFRSMHDGRVTVVGCWIRATGLDEVLQFFNVLKGDMSMVGPRPLTCYDLQRLAWHAQDDVRFRVRPDCCWI